jgi:hypothetical protein
VCQAEIGELVFFREPGLTFDRIFGRACWVQTADSVDLQKHQNTITAEIEVSVGLGLCEREREQERVNIVVPKSWCMFDIVNCFIYSNHDGGWFEPSSQASARVI